MLIKLAVWASVLLSATSTLAAPKPGRTTQSDLTVFLFTINNYLSFEVESIKKFSEERHVQGLIRDADKVVNAGQKLQGTISLTKAPTPLCAKVLELAERPAVLSQSKGTFLNIASIACNPAVKKHRLELEARYTRIGLLYAEFIGFATEHCLPEAARFVENGIAFADALNPALVAFAEPCPLQN